VSCRMTSQTGYRRDRLKGKYDFTLHWISEGAGPSTGDGTGRRCSVRCGAVGVETGSEEGWSRFWWSTMWKKFLPRTEAHRLKSVPSGTSFSAVSVTLSQSPSTALLEMSSDA